MRAAITRNAIPNIKAAVFMLNLHVKNTVKLPTVNSSQREFYSTCNINLHCVHAVRRLKSQLDLISTNAYKSAVDIGDFGDHIDSNLARLCHTQKNKESDLLNHSPCATLLISI